MRSWTVWAMVSVQPVEEFGPRFENDVAGGAGITMPPLTPAAPAWMCAATGVPSMALYDRSQHTSAVPTVVPPGVLMWNVNAAVPVPSGSDGGVAVALPLRLATNVRLSGTRVGSLIRALPKAMVGTAIAAASPTTVKANNLLFCMVPSH